MPADVSACAVFRLDERDSHYPALLSREFSSHIGWPREEELPEFLACGCAAGSCKLEHYAAAYEADTGKYAGFRRVIVQVNRGGSVIYKPGKCINCELCVQVVARVANGPIALLGLGGMAGRGCRSA